MKSSVLIIDDDIALAEMLGIYLKEEGFQVSFCHDGDSALDIFRSAQPDLLLLDIMLPGKSGLEVCNKIRRESGIPIIMVTAKSDTADIVEGLKIGADDYIVKPFNPKELSARIQVQLRPKFDTNFRNLKIGDISIDLRKHILLIAVVIVSNIGEF